MATAIFVLILIKVFPFSVPITHDETATTVHYVHYNAWEIMMFPDNWPNNHILNTLLVKYSIALFGAHSWSVRLPNLLFLSVVCLGCLQNSMSVKPQIFLASCHCCIVLCQSISAGFFRIVQRLCLSVALEMTAISFLLSGICHQKILHLFLAADLLFSAYASFYFAPLVGFYVPVVASSYLEIGYKEEMAE